MHSSQVEGDWFLGCILHTTDARDQSLIRVVQYILYTMSYNVINFLANAACVDVPLIQFHYQMHLFPEKGFANDIRRSLMPH